VTKATKRSVVALLVISLVFGCQTGRQNSGSTSTVPITPLRVGLAYETLNYLTDDELAETLDTAVDIGATWIRFEFSWRDVQPISSQEYVWASFDRVIEQARRRNLTLLPVLAYTPPWARPSGCTTEKCAPADPSQFARFAAAAAQRYSQNGVHAWEIWNEPNAADFWQPAANAAAYTRLLRDSSEAIRRADPQALVVMGGLATLATGDGNVSIADFLSQPAESPVRLVDALAVHPYTYPNPPSRLGPWASPWLPDDSGLPYFRKLLSDLGTPNLPIWITEYGAPTGGTDAPSGKAPSHLSAVNHVTEAEQAEIAKDAIAAAASEPIIGALFWYTYRDLAAAADSTEGHYGIERVDGSQKPAFASLTKAIKSRTR
jgi:hypothetical protein